MGNGCFAAADGPSLASGVPAARGDLDECTPIVDTELDDQARYLRPVLLVPSAFVRCSPPPPWSLRWAMRTGPPVVTDSMAARAMDRAARASAPVTVGVRPVRTVSVKSASSAT